MSDEIRIKIGVSLDASPGAILAPLETAVRRTRRSVEQNMGAAGSAISKETAKGVKQAAKEYAAFAREMEREEKRKQAVIRRSSEMAGREAAKAANAEIREKERASREIARVATDNARRIAREQVRIQRDASREIAKAKALEDRRGTIWNRDLLTGQRIRPGGGAIGIGRRAGLRVSQGVAALYGYGGSALSSISATAMDFAHGLGYDTDLQSHVREARDQQVEAQKISSAGNVPGTALVDPSTILAKAREVGNATGTDVSDALGALKDFVGKTGDLKTGLDSLQQMATLSKATGTRLQDMSNASAEVANQLGDVPDKAQVVYTIMKQIAGQGKLGAVEIRDLAKQMAKLGAASSRFAGGAQKNISTLGVIAQEAKLRGGAASATQAAQSVVAFASGFSTGATFKHWTGEGDKHFAGFPVNGHPGKREGINPFTDSSHRELSDPMEIIKAALSATRGDQTKLSALFPSKQGFRAVAGFASIYNQAAASAVGSADAKDVAGIKAVTDEFERLKKAQLDEQEIHRAFAARMRDSDSKAAIFNNKMSEVAEKLAGAVLPSLDSFSQALVTGASGFATAFQAMFPEGKRAEDSAKGQELVGEGAKAVGRVKSTATEEMVYDAKVGGFRLKKTYSGEAIDVAKETLAKQNASLNQISANAKNERADARSDTIADKMDIFGVAKWGAHLVGRQTFSERAESEKAAASKDEATVDALRPELAQQATALGDILKAIQEQTAVIKAPPAPSARPEPGAPADADTGEQ